MGLQQGLGTEWAQGFRYPQSSPDPPHRQDLLGAVLCLGLGEQDGDIGTLSNVPRGTGSLCGTGWREQVTGGRALVPLACV